MGKSIVVIGGGASGFMAAITAANGGAKVTVLEQNSKLGKKILSTGNGRCNLTNLNQDLSFYRSEDQEFIKKVLSAFSVEHTLSFFRSIGLHTKDRGGYVYPRSNQAISVVELLERTARNLKIKCKMQEEAVSVEKTDSGFVVNTKTWHYPCDSVILACGSKASVIEGSNGKGYELAMQLGHSVVQPLPALTGLKGQGAYFSKWAGVRCDANITLLIDNRKIISESGELQLTDYGLSGIPVFQVSRYASKALAEKKNVKAMIDFLPEYSESEAEKMLAEEEKKKDLIGLFPAKLAELLSEYCVSSYKSFEVPIKAAMDYTHAQVCTGGVPLEELCADTMESKLISGIYFCGELVDVDGACGGYNLQWAWSSGYVAGSSAAREL